jgi:hypothetical protein
VKLLPGNANRLAMTGPSCTFNSAAFPLNQRTRLDLAFGWNLLGAVCGGFLEFVAMQTGLKALYGVAAVLYCAAFLCAQRSRIEVLVPLQAASQRESMQGQEGQRS